MVTHAQSVRSLVVKYGFDGCSKHVGSPENGKRGVKPSRRWNSSDVPRYEPDAAPASMHAWRPPPKPVMPLAGPSSLNVIVVSACSSGIGAPEKSTVQAGVALVLPNGASAGISVWM